MDLNEERREYWAAVNGIADEIVDGIHAGDIERDEWTDSLHERVDSNYWVTYTYQAKLVVAFLSENDSAAEDAGVEIDHSAGINWIALAYFAMEQDVIDQIDFDELDAD